MATKNDLRSKRRPPILRFLVLLLLACCLIYGTYIWYIVYVKPFPSLQHSGSIDLIEGKMIRDMQERKIIYVPMENLPGHLIDAVTAIEDSRFYEHPGIDVTGILRAITVNLFSGQLAQGGSTITQQLAKNLFLEHDRTVWRKASEMALALKLEKEFAKDDIMGMYLNQIYFGHGNWGIYRAAESYFHKKAEGLTLGESAFLAGIIQAPNIYASPDGWERGIARQKAVLNRMVQLGYITRDEAAGAVLPVN